MARLHILALGGVQLPLPILKLSERTERTEIPTKQNKQTGDCDLFQDGNTCAHVAAAHGSVEVVKELLMFNSAMVLSSRNDTEDATPLHLAAETGNAEVVKVLLEAGASASDEDKVCAA